MLEVLTGGGHRVNCLAILRRRFSIVGGIGEAGRDFLTSPTLLVLKHLYKQVTTTHSNSYCHFQNYQMTPLLTIVTTCGNI